ncbi:MAG: tetratricopeptide repeat protein [Arenimonas sp.]|nr:tetratricopeptide repeat protein [Arenimonas sp.]
MIWSKSPALAAPLLALALAGPAAARGEGPVGEVMAGEFALQQGDLVLAAGHYLEAARGSRDPGLAERAARIALLAGPGAPVADAIARWRELAPESMAVRAAAISFALEQGNAEDATDEAGALMALPAAEGLPVLLSALGDARGDAAIIARAVMRGLYESDQLPPSFGGWLAMAGLARRLEDAVLSEQLVVRGLERFPDDPRAHLLQASRLRERGLDEAARGHLVALGEPGRLAPELRRAAAREYGLLGDPLAAAATLAAGPQDEASLRQRARWLVAAGDRPALAALYVESATPSPSPERRLLLGHLAEALMRWGEAEQWYASVPRGPGHDQAALRLAGAQGRLGRLDQALRTLHELQVDQAADGEFVRDSYLLEAELLERRGRGDEALATFGRALEVFEGDPSLLYGRAMLHERAGRISPALADLQRILDDDPDSAQALNAYGYALAEHRQRYREALPYLERALALAPESAAILDRVGWVPLKLGRHASALELLERAWARQRDPEIAAHLGEALWLSGRKAEAREAWRAGLRLDPDNAALKLALETHEP